MSESELSKLLNRIARATTARGAKADLARAIGIRPQQLNDWLTRIYAPSGETALRLLKWVTAEEAKQKNRAGRASTRPARVTRKSQSTTNDKARSSPRER